MIVTHHEKRGGEITEQDTPLLSTDMQLGSDDED
jgi:hypothetical protein